MGCAEGIELAFFAARKPGQAVVLAQRRHAFAPPGEDFVRVGLMADVPYQLVGRRVVYVVQRNGKFNGTEVRRKVSAGLRDRVDQILPQLVRQLWQLLSFQLAQIGRLIDCFQ